MTVFEEVSVDGPDERDEDVMPIPVGRRYYTNDFVDALVPDEAVLVAEARRVIAQRTGERRG